MVPEIYLSFRRRWTVMENPTLVDTGPLVALLDRNDSAHHWSVDQLKRFKDPLHTCESVFSECVFLLRKKNQPIDRLTGLVTDGILQLDFYLGPQFEAVLNLMSKYRDTPMSLADACLVRMSEIFPRSRVFTLDSDFLHYRRNGRSVIPLIYPGDQR